MSFEDLFGRELPEDDEPEEEDDGEWPAWWGPPSSELGVCVPHNIVVARSPHAVVALSHARVYSTGVAFAFGAYGRGLKPSKLHGMFRAMHGFAPDEPVPDTFLRLGVELADGSRASNLDARRDFESEPDGPLFRAHGGGGGSSSGSRFDTRPGYWLWPLPQPGTLRLWCEWPALEIALTSVELDASAHIAAADRSQKIWDD